MDHRCNKVKQITSPAFLIDSLLGGSYILLLPRPIGFIGPTISRDEKYGRTGQNIMDFLPVGADS